MQTKLFNFEAEKALLGCLLSSPPPEIFESVFTQLTAEDIFCAEYREIFFVVQTLFAKGKTIDLVTINETLDRVKKADTNYTQIILECINEFTNFFNFESYVSIILEYSKLRKIERLTGEAVASIEKLKPSAEVLQTLAIGLDDIALERIQAIEPLTNATQSELVQLKQKTTSNENNSGVLTGFPVLDSVLFGLHPSELVVVGARAGVGKTAFALNILDYVGNTTQKPCLFFSLEMPKNQIANRLLSLISGVPNTELSEPKNLTETRTKLLEQAERRIAAGQIFIDDTTDNTVQSMLIKARQFKRKYGLELVVVDYLQFVKPSKKSGNRYLDVGEIARELKVMARQLQVPVVALCQLNRALDNEDRVPTMADLRESGEIENNADIIMFLHNRSERFDKIKNIDLILGKFRRGEMRAVRMQYKGNTYRFNELDKAKKEATTQLDDLIPVDDSNLPF